MRPSSTLFLLAVAIVLAFFAGYTAGAGDKPACVHTDGSAAARAQVRLEGKTPCGTIR